MQILLNKKIEIFILSIKNKTALTAVKGNRITNDDKQMSEMKL